MMANRIKFSLTLLTLTTAFAFGDDLRQRIDDKNGWDVDTWVYNDIAAGIKKAKAEDKPLFITFRCVPCHDCAAFDADVASGNQRVKKIAREKFVSVRQVEMKDVDLSQFEFDFDLNWAAIFINADGTIYARYGTQSADGADAYNSIDGLINTMNRVLELHADYPNNRTALEGKKPNGPSPRYAIEMPGLQNPDKYKQQTTRKNCIHCHNIHDAQNMHAQQSGKFKQDILWRYPLPDNIGLSIDPVSGLKIQKVENASATAGIKAGETVQLMNGQLIASIADMQWILHALPNTNTQVDVTTESGKHRVILPAGWKKSDISWRGSMWSIAPRMRVWMPPIRTAQRKAAGLPENTGALEVRWINHGQPGGRAAAQSGLKQGDVVVELEGQPINMDAPHFQQHIKLNYKVGQELPLTVLRNKKRIKINVKLVE